MIPLWAVALVVVAALVVLVYHGIAIVFAYQVPPLAPAPPQARDPNAPLVSVVVAARNEEIDLPAALDSLVAQDYPNLEIVVADGRSTDTTPSIIDARAPRVRRIAEPPLPPGWVGKNFGCHLGAEATRGPWILFVDADVRLHPAAVRTTVDWAEQERADLVTIAPRVEMVGPWEKLVLPLMTQLILTYFRTPRVNRDRSRAAMANGQYLLVRRAAYEAVGGHAAVRAFVLEDVAIARRFRAAGKRLRIAYAPTLATTRLYRDRAEMFEGLLKNVHGFTFSAARQVGFLAALIGFYLLPLGLLPLGVVTGTPLWIAVGAFLYVALFGKMVGFARELGAGARWGLLWPIAVGFYLALVATSLVRGMRGAPVAWKGRWYRMTVDDLSPVGGRPNR